MSSIMRKSIDNVKQMASTEVLEAVHAVMHQLRARHHRDLRDAELGVTPMEARVLGFFARQPGATLTELAEHAGRDKGQLARLVQGLRDRGLLEAETDAHDRRLTRLSPSPPARSLLDALQRQRRRQAEAAVAGFSSEDCDTLLALLARVRSNLEA
jgi:DNA-binding MarR family transcriptional regulator